MLFPARAIVVTALLSCKAHAVPHDVESRSTNGRWTSLLDPTHYKSSDIIHRDVAIIGGGSAGTYTAVQLHDSAKSVVVIDRKARLGGHAETYTDPRTGTPIDIGVVVFANIKLITDYFARLNVSLTNLTQGNSNTSYVNFATGENVDFQPPAQDDVAAAFKAYAAQIAKYPTLQSSFNMTYPVAQDLLLPFGEFVDKYNLGAMMYTVFLTNQGFSPLLKLSTVYMVKYLNDYELGEFQNGFLTTKNHDIAALYDSAAHVLGDANLLLNSEVAAMDRSQSAVRIAVSTPTGRKLVVARKLVSAVPPVISNLNGYDLHADETGLFKQFFANGYYTGLLNGTGLAAPGHGYENVDCSQPYDIPVGPGIYSLTVDPRSNLTHVYSASQTPQQDEVVKKQIEADINRVRRRQGKPECALEWVTFSNHSPFNLQVSAKAIAGGYYKKLYGLNGQRHTFWTGAAFQSQDSGKIWQFNKEYLLPILLGSLNRS